MKNFKIWVNDQKGIATTEFIIVGFVFVIIFASFVAISNTVLFKIKSLIWVRNLAFNQTDGIGLLKASFNREVVLAGQTGSLTMDKCFSAYLASRPSRVKAHIDLEVSSFFKGFIPAPKISDRYLIAEDTWKGLSPVIIGSLVAGCPG